MYYKHKIILFLKLLIYCSWKSEALKKVITWIVKLYKSVRTATSFPTCIENALRYSDITKYTDPVQGPFEMTRVFKI